MVKQAKNKKSVQSLDELYLDAMSALEDEQVVEDTAVSSSTSAHSLTSIDSPKGNDLELEVLDSSEESMQSWQQKGLKSSADLMTVTLWVTGGGPISSKTIKIVLDQLGIEYGIDENALRKAEELTRDPDWRGELVVARGSEPEVGRRMHHVVMQQKKAGTGEQWLVDGVELDFDELQAVFVVDEISCLQDSTLMVKAVKPGERLIEVIDNPSARPGRDVFGTLLEVITEPMPLCGTNVRFNEKKSCIEALLFGYLLIIDDIVSVLLPMWMKPDHLAAFYVNFPQVGTAKHPTPMDILNILILMGINKRCVSGQMVKQVCERIASGDKAKTVMVAESVQPILGKDAEFSLSFDNKKKAGVVRDDGSIDLRERNAAVSVKAGQLIAVKKMATNGISGVTLLGKKIKTSNGKDNKINFGVGVSREKSIENIKYYAAVDGNVHFSNNTLTVIDVMQVDGDVGYATGNLDVNTDLEISGSVVAGFSVKAKGSVFIKGTIENGATVISGDELIVQKGILGEDTRVISMGNLQAGFIQDSEVLAKGEVVINSYLYNAKLRANGKITVLKGQGKRSGRVIGGICCSSKAIVTCYAGSSSSSGTLLSIQSDPEINGQLKMVEGKLQVCNSKISKISRTLPFDFFDTVQIKAYLVTISVSQRESVIQLLNTLNKFIKLQKSIREKKDILVGRVNYALQHGVIRVSSEIFQGSEIEFGQKKFMVSSDLDKTVFKYDSGKIYIAAL